jgi:hypothetical protein
MKQIHLVAPEHIHQVWGEVEPLLNQAFVDYDKPDYDVAHLKVLIINQLQYLFVVADDDKIIGAFTVEIMNCPNHRIAHTTSMGGKGVFSSDTVEQYEGWARLQGVTKIRAYAQDAQARLFKQKLGLEKVTTVVEKLL